MQDQIREPRGLCLNCRQPIPTCFCKQIEAFDPAIKFAILIHGIEARKRLSTGRLSHLILSGSELIKGYNYTLNKRVNDLIADPEFFPTVLYPGALSRNLSRDSIEDRAKILPLGKKLLVFVIDGTWTTARKTIQRSQNLAKLPRITFDLPRPSRFRVRRQPGETCYATIEAIHETIELMGVACGFATETRQHDRLLERFDYMVEEQLGMEA
jgi:DTW domain-containing protein YfiP